MKQEGTLKRILSVILSVVLIVSSITVTQPTQANAADPSANILTNGGFDNASDKWKDQADTLVGAQAVVDDVIRTEYMTNGDFEGETTNYNSGNNANATIVEGEGVDGSRALKFTRADASATSHPYVCFTPTGLDTTGTVTYTLSFKLRSTGAHWQGYIVENGSTADWGAIGWTAANDTWTEYEFTFVTTTGTAQIGIQAVQATGDIYIDNLSIYTEEKVKVQDDKFAGGNFEGAVSYSQGNVANATIVEGEGVDGSKALKFTRADESATSHPYVCFTPTGLDTTGTVTYTLSFKLRSTGAHWQGYITENGDTANWGAIGWTAADNTWTEYEFNFVTTTGTAQIGIQAVQATGDIYIDDFRVYSEKNKLVQTYTEGIGTCNAVEPDNVLAMKDYTKVTQDVTIKNGNQYDYSFMVKSENAGEGFAFGVTAGDNTTDAVTVTSEWKEVTGSFTATADATEFGFTRSGTGTVLIDDVVLNETVTGPADHTANGGAYIPAGHINTLKGDTWDFSSDVTGQYSGGATKEIANKTLKISELTNSQYVQTTDMPVEAGVTYRFSCYVYVEDATGKLDAAIYHIPAAGLGWENYACTLPEGNTEDWQLMTYEFTPNADGNMQFGFINRNTESATVYVDDIALTRTKPTPSDHTVKGGAYIPDGNIAVYSNDMSANEDGFMPTDFSRVGGSIENGMMKLPFTGSNYVPVNISVTAGVTYTFSYYVWVENAAEDFQFSIYEAEAIGWQDHVVTDITEDTNGWVKVVTEITPTSTKNLQIGFKNYGAGAGTVYLDDVVLSAQPQGTPTDITFSYDMDDSSNFHWEVEYRLYMRSTGTEEKPLSGDITINGTKKTITYHHSNEGIVLFFDDLLDENIENVITIPAGTILYDGINKIYRVSQEFTIYTKKVDASQWMTWTSEYDLTQKVQYFDMGTKGTVYTFNNNPSVSYQGVLVVEKPDHTKVVLGGNSTTQATATTTEEVTTKGDYTVSRSIKGEKYDYTVALYQRGDADKTMDGQLTSLDLVAAKRAVGANEATFGHARYKAADSNTDGVVDEKDAAFMRRVLANGFEIHKTATKGYSTLGQGVMPIIGYGGPSDDTTKNNPDVKERSTQGGFDNLLDGEDGERVFSLVQELGINVFSSQVHQVGDKYNDSCRMLKMADKYGLGVYINNAYLKGSDAAEQLSKQTAKYESFGSFYGYYLADEPGRTEIGNYTTQLTTLKNHVNIASYFNLKPIWDDDFRSNKETRYKEYLNSAFTMDTEAVAYDLYLRGKTYKIGKQGEIRTADFYKSLDLARTASKSNKNKPFQAFVQTGAQWKDGSNDTVNKTNRVTIQEMYLEANAALAMGAKGIHYFNLIESVKQVEAGDNDSGLITIKGEKNNNEGGDHAYYDAAKKINTYVAKIDEVLMNATSKGVMVSDNTVSENINCCVSNYGVVNRVTGSDYMVGCFDYYGKDAYLIVNISPDEGGTGTPQSITLKFNSEVSYDYTRMDGKTGTGNGTSMTETVGAGESVLVVVD